MADPAAPKHAKRLITDEAVRQARAEADQRVAAAVAERDAAIAQARADADERVRAVEAGRDQVRQAAPRKTPRSARTTCTGSPG